MLHSEDSLIVHVDMDAFFASVEQLLIPVLRGRPVIVGSGCIASCSYEARARGLHAGMGLSEAKRLCPQAVILKGDYQIYRCLADQVWDVCRRYTCGLETFLDEAYGDAGGLGRLYGRPDELGRRLQQEVHEQVHLPVSVGLGENRMLAKLASHAAKPRGVVWVAPGEVQEFLRNLPVRKLLGVGPTTGARLADMNIQTVGQLQGLSREFLRAMLGQRGEVLYERARGRDAQALQPQARPRSISRETTFHSPTCNRDQIAGMLFYLTERAIRTARGAGLAAGAVEVSIRYDDWRGDRRQQVLAEPSADDDVLFNTVKGLLATLYSRRVSLRHVRVVLSKFSRIDEAGKLFESSQEARRRQLHQTIDAIRDRYGHAAVVSGKSIELLGKLDQNDYGFVLRTPSLTK
ncbi:MAG: DNA polymerase IV [Planctomycetaceae bacterium]|nr:DNA polymerase IV [Planctomycetaceae bacterium]